MIFFIFFLTATNSIPANAFFEAGLDAMGSVGASGWTIDGHTYIHFGGQHFTFGPAAEIRRPSTDILDYLVGGGIKWEPGIFFLQTEGGFLYRQLQSYRGPMSGRGYYFDLAPGLCFGPLRLSLPFLIRRIESGLNPRWTIDSYPYIGLRFKI